MEYPTEQPQDQPLSVVDQRFCSTYPLQLSLHTKGFALSGRDFIIKDFKGNLVCKVAGKLFSLHSRTVLHDAAGNCLLTMKSEVFSRHGHWKAFRGEIADEQSFLFSAKEPSVCQRKTAVHVFMAGNKDHKVVDFRLEGSPNNHSFTVYKDDRIIAEMKRKFVAKDLLIRRQTFTVNVLPGADYAFIVALMVKIRRLRPWEGM